MQRTTGVSFVEGVDILLPRFCPSSYGTVFVIWFVFAFVVRYSLDLSCWNSYLGLSDIIHSSPHELAYIITYSHIVVLFCIRIVLIGF